MPTIPIVKSAIADFTVAANSASTLNLLDNFDDPFTTGLVATFQLYDTNLGNGGTTNVVLFDQAGEGAPESVQNFRDYVNSNAYVDSFIHRTAQFSPGTTAIVQGGGFTVTNFDGSQFTDVTSVPTNDPLDNDYSANRPNRRGTLAFAKLGGDPDSATSQWFFNTVDNTTTLGPTNNGGFSVFGEVVSSADLLAVDAIGALPTDNFGGAFGELPINRAAPLPDPFSFNGLEDLVRYRSITIAQQRELSFEVISNSNPSLITPSFLLGSNPADGRSTLALDYAVGRSGSAELTVRATTLQGVSVEDSFSVTVNGPSPGEVFSEPFIVWDTTTSIVSRFRLGESSLTFDVASIGRTIEDTNWKLQTTGDFNGDGQDDVLLRHFLAGQNLVWYMEPGGNAIASETLIGREVADPNWSLSGTGDLDGDGKTDIILRNETADQIVAWYMNDDGTIKGESLIGRSFGDNNWKIEATADFNGDGKTDIVLRNALAGQNLLWTMDGANILGEALIGRDVPGADWQIEAARDFNSDGIIDIFWRQTTAGQGLLWTMASPTQIAQEQLLSGVPDGTSQIVF